MCEVLKSFWHKEQRAVGVNKGATQTELIGSSVPILEECEIGRSRHGVQLQSKRVLSLHLYALAWLIGCESVHVHEYYGTYQPPHLPKFGRNHLGRLVTSCNILTVSHRRRPRNVQNNEVSGHYCRLWACTDNQSCGGGSWLRRPRDSHGSCRVYVAC